MNDSIAIASGIGHDGSHFNNATMNLHHKTNEARQATGGKARWVIHHSSAAGACVLTFA